MLTHIRAFVRRVRASQRRRAQRRGDPLLSSDATRARARTTLGYYNRGGDPPGDGGGLGIGNPGGGA
jgi:hypothetical protein